MLEIQIHLSPPQKSLRITSFYNSFSHTNTSFSRKDHDLPPFLSYFYCIYHLHIFSKSVRHSTWKKEKIFPSNILPVYSFVKGVPFRLFCLFVWIDEWEGGGGELCEMYSLKLLWQEEHKRKVNAKRNEVLVICLSVYLLCVWRSLILDEFRVACLLFSTCTFYIQPDSHRNVITPDFQSARTLTGMRISLLV